jgi:hypothetical protein
VSVPDLPSPHPTNTRDGAALLSERFAARVETGRREPAGDTPLPGTSVAAQLLATWFATVRSIEEKG